MNENDGAASTQQTARKKERMPFVNSIHVQMGERTLKGNMKGLLLAIDNALKADPTVIELAEYRQLRNATEKFDTYLSMPRDQGIAHSKASYVAAYNCYNMLMYVKSCPQYIELTLDSLSLDDSYHHDAASTEILDRSKSSTDSSVGEGGIFHELDVTPNNLDNDDTSSESSHSSIPPLMDIPKDNQNSLQIPQPELYPVVNQNNDSTSTEIPNRRKSPTDVSVEEGDNKPSVQPVQVENITSAEQQPNSKVNVNFDAPAGNNGNNTNRETATPVCTPELVTPHHMQPSVSKVQPVPIKSYSVFPGMLALVIVGAAVGLGLGFGGTVAPALAELTMEAITSISVIAGLGVAAITGYFTNRHASEKDINLPDLSAGDNNPYIPVKLNLGSRKNNEGSSDLSISNQYQGQGNNLVLQESPTRIRPTT